MVTKKLLVLVVEDEPLVRISIVAELEDHGLQVMEASNAHEAVAVLGDNPVVNVIFTDVDMPGSIDGIELAKIVRERFPPIQVVVTSGHRNVLQSDLPPEAKFIPKPTFPKRLSRPYWRSQALPGRELRG